MARLSVKVPTALAISRIEEKIASIEAEIIDYPAKRKQYEADKEAYKTKVVEFVTEYLSKNINSVGYDHSDLIRITTNYAGRVELTFDPTTLAGFPENPVEPKNPSVERIYVGRDYVSPLSVLKKNLDILKMTSQEEISASAYGAVLELL